MVRLWVHECGRVFCDRLNDEKDVKSLFDQLYVSCRDLIKEDLFTCLKNAIPEDVLFDTVGLERNSIMMKEFIKFTDLNDPMSNPDKKSYDELSSTSMPDLVRSLNESMNQFCVGNDRDKKIDLDLVLFDYAVTHLLRICRIIRMYKGNALLIGVGGSGRQSLSFLASYLMH